MDLCNRFDYVASNRRLMSRATFYRDVWRRIESALDFYFFIVRLSTARNRSLPSLSTMKENTRVTIIIRNWKIRFPNWIFPHFQGPFSV